MLKERFLSITFATIVFFAFSCLVGNGRSDDTLSLNGNGTMTPSLSTEDFIKDVDFLVSLMDEVHGDPYRLIPRKKFIENVNALKQEILQSEEKSISSLDVYFKLQALTATIQDGHTNMEFPQQYLTDIDSIFPFAVKVIDGKLFIIEKWNENSIPLYSEILEINGIPLKVIFSESMNLFSSPLPHGRLLAFERYLHVYLLTYFDLRPPWRVKFKRDTESQESETEGIAFDEYGKRIAHQARYRAYTIKVNGAEIPVLDIPSFAHGSGSDYRAFIDDFFKKYREANYLIIDLRRNRGGNGAWGYYLLDYLTDSPYQTTSQFDIKISDIYRKSPYRNKVGEKLNAANNGDYLPNSQCKIRNPHGKMNKYAGKVFLFTSHETFSAGVVTAAIFKFNKMGTIIGQETSGRIKFCSDPIPIQLPHSRLRINIPLAIYALPGGNPDRGVIPDIHVQYTIEDYQNHIDKECLKLQTLIKTP